MRLFVALFLIAGTALAEPLRFKVATYNVENYLLKATGTRTPKPAAARAKVVETLLSAKPDVLAVQEMGPPEALRDLQEALKKGGLDLPHFEHVGGFDTNIFVGVLSRFPIVARRPHSKESFLLEGRRWRTSRGIAEVEIGVTATYRFTLLTTHLKSKRTIPEANESELREQEAVILREKIDDILRARPEANVLVCGDFNDTKDSRAIRSLIGRNASVALVDTRPVERNGRRPTIRGGIRGMFRGRISTARRTRTAASITSC
jgi:endonuclease/exonuclease/phosphatase family metal-dependent hydrolase